MIFSKNQSFRMFAKHLLILISKFWRNITRKAEPLQGVF